MKRGKFIVVEGIDGAGTTTLSQALTERISAVSQSRWTCEPSVGSIGMLIRRILEGSHPKPSHDVMELLFRADRRDHDLTAISPLLESGINVICDRYFPSTLVYQTADGIVSGAVHDAIGQMRHMYQNMSHLMLVPDAIIFLQVNQDIASKRRASRKTKEDVYEKSDYLNTVYTLYSLWAMDAKCRSDQTVFMYQDGSKPAPQVADEVYDKISSHWSLLTQ